LDNEELFLMLEECVAYASVQLTKGQSLESFAMVLDTENNTHHISVEQMDGEIRYEELLDILRVQAKDEKIIALALLSNVTIPDNFNPSVSTGIRLHIEEKNFKADNKLSARLLYVPYQLFKTASNDTIEIKLLDPIPVGLACEIFDK